MKNDQSSFKITQDFEIVPPKKGKAYPIPKVEWDYIKERIRKIGDVVNIYHTAGAVILGYSGSAFINLFILDFPKNQDGSLSNKYILCLAIAICTLIIGAMAFFFGKKQREDQAIKSDDVVKWMQVIEMRYHSGYEQEVPQKDSLLEIIKAIYGTTEDKSLDVTKELQDMIVDNKLEIIASNAIKGDPDPGTKKRLIIEYRFNGKTLIEDFKEKQIVIIP